MANNTPGESAHGRTQSRPRRHAQEQQQQTTEGETSTLPNAAGEGPSGRPSRGRGRGRGGGPRPRGQERGAGQRERQPATKTTVIGGRTFGRGLTRDEDVPEDTGETSADRPHDHKDTDTQGHELRADAPEFVPGRQQEEQSSAPAPSSGACTVTKAKSKPAQPKPRAQKVTTKSVAPDLPTRIHEDIANNLYECPICAGELGRRSRVWSCRLCWSVFHLSCIKKWSRNEGSVFHNQQQQQQQQGENGTDAPRQWRCPGCNLPQDVLPSTYSCWCEKEIDPRPLPGLPPHSCGQTCSRPRKGCPHPCDSTCHAGPCPPCTAMGPTQDCFCGKNSSTKRCVDTDYVNGWSCGEICGDLLPCGEHTCPRPCHEGLCGACEVKVDAKCYCGKVQTQMLCSSKDEEIPSRRLLETGQTEGWIGSFNCGEICNRPFDCGVHFCQRSCHPQDADPPHCPKSPDVVLRCPCGKTPLDKIPGFTPRTSCEDPIPNCQEPCRKILPCGHECPMVCHTGPCRPCLRTVSIKCRCGRSEFSTICHQGKEEPPQCFRVCKATMNCGRHSCTERCCPGEHKALERQATKRKLKSLNVANRADDEIEAEHICTRVCGRILKCEKHTCPDLCHKGSCSTCREAIFEEISCNCGRTVLHPPLPCGTKPPPCTFNCERPKPCGHPQTPHNCHTDEESCPKCPFLTEKKCLCGKRVLKNQPCWLTDARCGLVCGEPLKCGSHSCQKQCHRPGDCEDAVTPCQQACGKTKSLCGHPCTEPCHAPFACPEKTPCSTVVTVTCGCGRLRQEKRCNAAKAVTSKGQTQQQQQLPSLGPLECDDECRRLERNRNLASALNIDIDPSTTLVNPTSSRLLSSTNLPYSAETLDMYIKLSSSTPLSTLQGYESTLDGLAKSSTQRSVRFQPAKAPLRAFVHSLAADWGFASESFDPEPHRHVFVLKPTSWTPPLFGLGNNNGTGIGGMTVGECVKVRERERMKEREAQRAAAAEAKAQRDAANAAASSGTEGGWAQVASRKRPSADATNNAAKTWGAPPASNGPNYGSMYAALAADGGSNGKPRDRLVLRSGVGAGQKKLQTQTEEVADSWEEEVEKEEEEERKEMEQHQQQQQSGRTSPSPDGQEQGQDIDVVDIVEKKLDDVKLSTVPEEGAETTACAGNE